MKRNLLFLSVSFLCLTLSLSAEVDKCCPAPYDKVVSCEKLPHNFNPRDIDQLEYLFGRASRNYGCKYYYVRELSPTIKLNSCNIGKIIRKFEVDPGGYDKYICEQEIEITGHFHYAIEFPKDASANCTVPKAETVKFHQFGCDLLTVNVTDEKFRASGDECYKVLRTYRVINWCEFDERNSRPIVIDRDEDCDGWQGDEPVFVIRKEDGTVFVDRDKESYNFDPPQKEIDKSCGHDGYRGYWRSFSVAEGAPYYPRRGYYQYTQVLKVFDHIKPEVEVGAYDEFCTYQDGYPCSGNVTIPFKVDENCTPNDLDIKVFFFKNKQKIATTQANNLAKTVLSGNYPNYEIQGSFLVGEHDLEIHVADGCGASTSVRVPFEVRDCKAPAPTCIETLNAKMEPVYDEKNNHIGGQKEIWAMDFLASDYHNDCGPPITYSIHRRSAIESGEEVPDPDQVKLTLDCDDLPISIIYVYAWDKYGNHDRCEVAVWLQDDNYYCDSPYSHISGLIQTETGATVENVEIALSGESQDLFMTPTNGRFAFNGLEPGMDYTVNPSKSEHITNGVSTLDMVLISQHILGIKPLDSPYKLIAADINNSQSITTVDLIFLRKAILHIDKEFQNNTSWRFVPKNYTFPDSIFPLEMAFPEVANFNDIDSTGMDADFVGIKIGDVSNDVIANKEGMILPNFEEHLSFEITDRVFQKGGEVNLDFNIKPNQPVIGTQFTFEFDPNLISFKDIELGESVNLEHFNLNHLEEGWFTFSWYTNASVVNPLNLFSLKMSGQSSAKISEAIKISSIYTEARAYLENKEEAGVEIKFVPLQSQEIEVYQNQPNPFSNSTSVQFYLPTENTITFSIFSATGKLIQSRAGKFEAGMHSLHFDGTQFPKGVLIYQLKAGDTVKSMKMVVQ